MNRFLLLLMVCMGSIVVTANSVDALMGPLDNVIQFSPASTKNYLGSPSLLRLPNGDILASMDLFGEHAPRSENEEHDIGLIFRSSDDGASWDYVTEIQGTYWANLFLHRGAIYLLGTSEQNGHIVIRRSDDNGETWTQPVDSEHGLLFPSGEGRAAPNYHCAPMPVLEHNGRLYRAFEDNVTSQGAAGLHSLVISAPVDADLLNASSWTMSNKLKYNQNTDPPAFGQKSEDHNRNDAGWLEGNIVLAPDGRLVNILRCNSMPVVDKAAMLNVSQDGKIESFDPKTGFFDFPGGMTKFAIRYDDKTQRYWTLANGNTNPKNAQQRNRLAAYSSSDLRRWKFHEALLEDLDDFDKIGNDSKVGFQYVDFRFDGDDIIFMSRTAYKGAHNYHDANFMTFHRISDFRTRYK
ncbi:MAG: sialidase family protein [Candidatus Hinthialibacter antarcticus]|nr:sialidase family protein [Candidatus Hinthialibacter antarcticus]